MCGVCEWYYCNMSKRNSFLTIIKESESYLDFVENLKELNSSLKGQYFEKFAEYYFRFESNYEIQEYYDIKSSPYHVIQKLGIPNKDIGIDAIFRANDLWYPVQVKFKSNIFESTPWKNLSTFVGSAFGISDYFEEAILFTSAKRVNTNIMLSKKIRFILGWDLEQIPNSFFRKIQEIEETDNSNQIRQMKIDALDRFKFI